MERPQTATENKSGIPVMSTKGKYTGTSNVSPESPGRSAIPRLQARSLQPNRSFVSFKTDFDQKINTKITSLRSKSFDEKTDRRGFEMMTHGDKNQLRKQISSGHLEDLHKPRSKTVEGKSPRGSSLPRSALDTARRRASSISRSTHSAAKSPSELSTPISEPTTPIKPEIKKKKLGRPAFDTKTRLPELAFNAKKKKLEQLKNELQAKQKQVMEAYTSILETKKLIEEKTGKKVEVENIHLNYEEKKPPTVDNDMVEKMEQKIAQMSDTYQSLCEELVENRTSILHWLSLQHACKNHVVTKQLELYRKDSDRIRQKVTDCQDIQTKVVSELVEDWTKLWEWEESCINGRFKELESENRRVKDMLIDFQSELEKFRSIKLDLEKKLHDTESTVTSLKKKLEEKEMEYLDNKTKSVDKQNANNFESKLKMAQKRQKDLETKIKSFESKVEFLQTNNRKLEDDLKKKDSSFENRTKELTKSSKLHEALVAKMEKERIGLDMRIKGLEQLCESRELEYENNLKDYKTNIQTLESKIVLLQKEIENYDKKYSTVRDELVNLQTRNQDVEVTKKRKFVTDPGGHVNSQNELDMWTELQATRVALKAAEERLVRNNEEKERFLQTIQKAVTDKDEWSSEGWTAKLILKDEEIENLKHKIEQLSDTIVYSRDLATKQEKKISDLKKTLDSLVASDVTSNKERKENADQSSIELKTKLEQEHKKNQDLETKLSENESKMSQLQSKIKDQENLLKVRDGLIGIMKSKKDMTVTEYDQLREYVNDLLHQYNELNTKLQSKSAQVDDLFTSIECKTMQIERLEKTVKSMEDLCQESNKTNFGLQERIKCYQKQLDEYQLTVAEIRPSNEEEKGTVGIFYKPTEGKSYMITSSPV